MRIKEYNGAYPISQMHLSHATVELTHSDVSTIANAMYEYTKTHQHPEIKRLYSDFLVAFQLMESGTVDDWTLARVASHRGMDIKEAQNQMNVLPIEVIKEKK